MPDSLTFVLVIYAFLCAGAAAFRAPKGQGFDFFVLTLFLLGPLGVVAVLIVAALDPQKRAT